MPATRPEPGCDGVNAPGRAQIAAKTLRGDRWWLPQLVTGGVLALFAVYATVRAFQNSDYYKAPYLTPLYSPCLSTKCVPHSSDFGMPIGHWFPLSPAILDPDLPARLPADLLLLPQGLLPRVLAVAAGLRGGRAARQVHR